MEIPTQAKYWKKLDDNRIQCELCPRLCKIKEGKAGFCFIRANRGGYLELITYGLSTGFCIDPIEKKPLNHFYPGSSILSFGTAGCNLSCKFCQNWHMSHARQTQILCQRAMPGEIALKAKELNCKSVAFTYNDPVIFLEYAIDTAKECHSLGIQTVAVTAGAINELPREEFFSHMDAANVDLKSFSDNFYKKLCGIHLQPVLDTLIYIAQKTKVWLEITTLLIPGYNDTIQELDKMTHWIRENLGPLVPLHFSAFHPDGKMLDAAQTPISTLNQAKEIAHKNGLHHVFTGNVHDPRGSSSYCHNCGKLLIERDWYTLGKWNLTEEGKCAFCGTTLAGHFAAKPGDWGSKRMPVSL
jgi:pyruvate formate lyase activating enzyme